MKKFLTVLLALSVVFTYSFSAVGTAFAAAPTSEQKSELDATVDSVAANIAGIFNANYSTALNNLKGEDVITADNYKEAAEVYKTAQIKAINERAAEIKAEYAKQGSDYIVDTSAANITALFKEPKTTGGHKFTTEAVGNYETVDAVVTGIQNDAATKKEAATLAFNAAKEETMAIINVLDLTVFSTTIQNIGGEETSYYALAQKYVDQKKLELEVVVVEDTDNYDQIKEKVQNTLGFKNKYFKGNAYTGYTLTKAAREESNPKLLTIEEEGKDATTLEAKKALKLAEIQAKAAKVLSDSLNAANYQTVVVPTVDAYVLAQKYLVEAATSETELNDYVGTPSTHSVLDSKILQNVKNIEELEAVAAKYKLLKDDSGNLLKDADAIDEVVKAAKLKAYKMPASTIYDITADVNEIKNKCNIADALTTFTVEAKKAEIEKARDAALDKYYEPEKVKVNELFDSLITKVNAAKTDTEVNKIMTSDINAQLGLIKTKTAVQTAIKNMSAFTTDMTKLNEYKAYLNAGVTSYSKDYKDFAQYDNDFFADFYAEKGVRVSTDITADIYAQAKAVLDAVKSNGTIAEEKAAVEAMIKALPSVSAITTANKAEIVAAWTAAKEYKDAYGRDDLSNQSTLNAAVNQLLLAEKYELAKIYKKLPAKLTVADKATVLEYKAAIEAVLENVGSDKMYAENAVNDDITNCKAALETIRDLEAKAVQDAINALPLNITLNDKAAVEAARDAYDAFVKEYTVYAANTFAAAYNAAAKINTDELRLAEATINAEIINAVESLKITASSVAAKGSITVKWKVDGNYSVADGMRVYKSTKKNSGYGATPYFITKAGATQYKNTKELKKGTRYYYKVRAYVEIDGVKYYSDYSNKAYRIAK